MPGGALASRPTNQLATLAAGRGIYVWPDGRYYEGEFFENHLHGQVGTADASSSAFVLVDVPPPPPFPPGTCVGPVPGCPGSHMDRPVLQRLGSGADDEDHKALEPAGFDG